MAFETKEQAAACEKQFPCESDDLARKGVFLATLLAMFGAEAGECDGLIAMLKAMAAGKRPADSEIREYHWASNDVDFELAHMLSHLLSRNLGEVFAQQQAMGAMASDDAEGQAAKSQPAPQP